MPFLTQSLAAMLHLTKDQVSGVRLQQGGTGEPTPVEGPVCSEAEAGDTDT